MLFTWMTWTGDRRRTCPEREAELPARRRALHFSTRGGTVSVPSSGHSDASPHPCLPPQMATRSRSGQALIFLLVVLVILIFVVLWNYDIHRILYVKFLAQNGGDAAALAAARWQGTFLNLAGDLNIMQALAMSTGDTNTVASISDLQARLCFVGPMIAFMASQQAAKNNRAYVNEEFTEYLREHADEVRNDYSRMIGDDGELLFPEPYPGCWDEYADMLDVIAGNGVAAGPDNAQFYMDATSGHYLLMVDFYEAIAGRIWCWFFRDAGNLLEDYRNFQPCWWPALPDIELRERVNSEIFSLGLSKLDTRFSTEVDFDMASALATERGFDTPLTTNGLNSTATWYAYDQGRWSEWTAIDSSGEDSFPVIGPVKPRYNYAGADAATRIEAPVDRLTPGPGGSTRWDTIVWSAAAKPFGYLNEEDPPTFCNIVLPAFHQVRMIPVDTSSAPYGGGYNISWRRHIAEHLPDYMRYGPPATTDCWYCSQLITWEDPEFRDGGVEWLSTNSYLCTLPSYGGRYRGGGTRRGH